MMNEIQSLISESLRDGSILSKKVVVNKLRLAAFQLGMTRAFMADIYVVRSWLSDQLAA